MTVLFAILLDLWRGDPPNQWHPVVWMGTLIRRLRRLVPPGGKTIPFIGGAIIAWGGALAVGGIGVAIERLVAQFPRPLRWILAAVILKSTFSLKGLVAAARDVEAALVMEDLLQARHWLGWHLVSRDTSTLSEAHIVAATIESLAENLSDGVIAPLLYYSIGGLPAALVYRYLNTGDAMLGYRTEEYEWLGKIPARTDDIANLIPARVTALGILGAVAMRSMIAFAQFDPTAIQNLRMAITIYQRDRGVTASPNAGHPMSAMAGALGIELEKIDYYCLGAGLSVPRPGDIQRAVQLLYGATALSLGGWYGIRALALYAARSRHHRP